MIKLEVTEDELEIIVRSLEQSQSYIWAVQGSGGREQVEKRLRVLDKLSSCKDESEKDVGFYRDGSVLREKMLEEENAYEFYNG